MSVKKKSCQLLNCIQQIIDLNVLNVLVNKNNDRCQNNLESVGLGLTKEQRLLLARARIWKGTMVVVLRNRVVALRLNLNLPKELSLKKSPKRSLHKIGRNEIGNPAHKF